MELILLLNGVSLMVWIDASFAMEINEKNSECCPRFEPELWNDKTFEWNDKRFLKDRVRTFMFMPVNFGQVMRRLDRKVRDGGAGTVNNLCLARHASRWSMEVYLAVDKEVPGSGNMTLDGKYYCRTYEGPFRDTGKWCEDFEKSAEEKGFKTDELLMWYTTCPKCAKKYGKNHVAIFSRVAD